MKKEDLADIASKVFLPDTGLIVIVLDKHTIYTQCIYIIFKKFVMLKKTKVCVKVVLKSSKS